MTSPDGSDSDPLEQQIETARIEFERSWRAGDRPRIEDHLAAAGGGARSVLLRDLISQEVTMRREGGEAVHVSDYHARFPGQATTILDAFRQAGLVWEYDATELGSSPPGEAPAGAAAAVDLGVQRGRFRIQRLHAQGGLGKVSIAIDEELNREVALKEIQEAHVDNADNRRRFTMEAEITGRLEHPGVVPVYGLGIDPLGRPYYAMRLIRGESLSTAIRAFHDRARKDPGFHSRMGFRHLLARFVATCNAIHYAHSRGVIHRDLKPGNIMLGDYGETHVVDWGLAKSVGAPDDGGSAGEAVAVDAEGERTQFGSAVGTPAYMSPEQAAGKIDELGPHTDVYCLGATLYSLMTGTSPIANTDVETALARVRAGDFPRPRQVAPGVPKGLEAVCLKAMALRPADRYASARALADDVEHWLADEPVSAREDSLVERCARWMRRHRTWARATAASLLVITLVSLAASVVVHRYWREAERRRTEANDSFQKARQAVDDYFTRVSQERLLDEPGMQSLRRDLLELALDYYAGFVQEKAGDPSLRLALGETSYRIGLIQDQIGNLAEARQAFEQASVVLEALESTDRSPERRALLARAHSNLGLAQKASGQYAAADKSLARALAIRQELAAERPDDPATLLDLGKSFRHIASLMLVKGQSAQALEWFQKSSDTLAELSERHPDAAEVNEQLAATLTEMAIQQRTTNVEQAAESIERSVALWNGQLAESPDSQLMRQRLAASHFELSRLVGPRQPERSIPAIEQAIGLQESLVRENPRVQEYAGELARSCDWAAWILHQNRMNASVPDALERSFQLATRSTELLRKLTELNPQSIPHQQALINSLNMIGLVQRDRGNADPGLAAFDEALRVNEQLRADNPGAVMLGNDAVMTHHNKGRLLEVFQRFDEARTTYLAEKEVLRWMVDQDPANAEYRFRHANVFSSLAVVECRVSGAAVAAELIGELETIVQDAQTHRHYYYYAMACVHGVCAGQDEQERSRHIDRALDALRQAVEHGFDDFQLMRQDNRLAFVREDPRFDAIAH